MSGWVDLILDYKILSVARNDFIYIISIFAKRQLMKRTGLFLHFEVEALTQVSLFWVDKAHVELSFAFTHLVVIH